MIKGREYFKKGEELPFKDGDIVEVDLSEIREIKDEYIGIAVEGKLIGMCNNGYIIDFGEKLFDERYPYTAIVYTKDRILKPL
jgi:predicted ATP-dependent protease